MLIVLPEPVQGDTNNPDILIRAFNINSHSTIRICKVNEVYCVGLTQDIYNNKYTQKHYYISAHKSREEANDEIDNIINAFEKHHKVYRINQNQKIVLPITDPEIVVGIYHKEMDKSQ